MKILGIASNYHDASVSLVIDGIVVASAAEERFSYEKHDPSFPDSSIRFCLERGNITAQDLDYVIYHEDPQTKFTRSLASSFKNFPYSTGSFIKSAKDMLTVGFWIKNEISKALDISLDKIVFVPHHLSHAAHAFMTSPFEEATIMTIDAVGEWSTSCIFKAHKVNDRFKIDPVDLIPFPHSLGLVYSAFTGFLGFKVNDGECSTMALAAFGSPIYKEEIKKIIKIKEDGTYTIDLSYFDFSSNDKIPVTDKFIRIFGKARTLDEKIQYSVLDDIKVESENQKRYANIASSIQTVIQEAILGYAQRAKKLNNSENLCYAGGVALNCVANSHLVNSKIFKNVYVPPDPGDGGGAMGAAIYGAMCFDKNIVTPNPVSPYLGKSYEEDNEFFKMLDSLEPATWHRFSMLKIKPITQKLSFKRFESDESLCSFVAEQLNNSKILGWVQGRFENGPRALGNRSILCRPDCLDTARRLSSNIKVRSGFRPYACSILQEDANDYLKLETTPQLGSWMQSSFIIKENNWEKIKATSHIDKSTRAQILKKEENPIYHQLISEYKNFSGIPAVLNTSFNLAGFPLVSSPYDALLVFAKTDLDMIVVNRIVISKESI